MSRQASRAEKLFVDADGRLSKLLTRLSVKTSKVKPESNRIFGRTKEMSLVMTNAATVDDAIRMLGARADSRPKAKGKGLHRMKKPAEVSAALFAHARETFGSVQTARRWLSSECGALNNRTPLSVIRETGSEAEVDRVLSCIDYGIIA